jgi:hypothetical protein
MDPGSGERGGSQGWIQDLGKEEAPQGWIQDLGKEAPSDESRIWGKRRLPRGESRI